MDDFKKQIALIIYPIKSIMPNKLNDDDVQLWANIFIKHNPTPNIKKLEGIIDKIILDELSFNPFDGIKDILRHYNRATPAEYAAMSREERKNYSAKLMKNKY